MDLSDPCSLVEFALCHLDTLSEINAEICWYKATVLRDALSASVNFTY